MYDFVLFPCILQDILLDLATNRIVTLYFFICRVYVQTAKVFNP